MISELVEENHGLLPSGSVEDFSNQNGFSGLDQEEEGSWQDEPNEGLEDKRAEDDEEEETDDGEIFLRVEESTGSGRQQQQQQQVIFCSVHICRLGSRYPYQSRYRGPSFVIHHPC